MTSHPVLFQRRALTLALSCLAAGTDMSRCLLPARTGHSVGLQSGRNGALGRKQPSVREGGFGAERDPDSGFQLFRRGTRIRRLA